MQQPFTPTSPPQRRKSVAILPDGVGTTAAATTARRKSMFTGASSLVGLRRGSRRYGAADTLSNPSSPTTNNNNATSQHQEDETPPPHCTSSFVFCTYDQVPFKHRERATEILRSMPTVQSWEDVDVKCTQVLQIVATNSNPIGSRRWAELSGFSEELINSPYMLRPDEFLHILNLVVINQNNKLPIPSTPSSDLMMGVDGGGDDCARGSVVMFTGIGEPSGDEIIMRRSTVVPLPTSPRQTPRQAASAALTRQKEVAILASPRPALIGSYNEGVEREREMQAAVAFAMESLEAYSAALLQNANDSSEKNSRNASTSQHQQQPLQDSVSNSPASILSPTVSYSGGGGGSGGLGNHNNKVNWMDPSTSGNNNIASSTSASSQPATISIAEALGLPVPHQDFAIGGSVPKFNEIRANRRQDVAKMFVERVRGGGGFGSALSEKMRKPSQPNNNNNQQQQQYVSGQSSPTRTQSPASPSSPLQAGTTTANEDSNQTQHPPRNDDSDPVSDILFNHMNLVPEDFVSLFSESTEEKAVRWAYRQLGAVWRRGGPDGGGEQGTPSSSKPGTTAATTTSNEIEDADGEGHFMLLSDTLYQKSIQCGNAPEVASALVATFDVSSEGTITFDQFCNGLAQRVELSQVLPPSPSSSPQKGASPPPPPTKTKTTATNISTSSSYSPHLTRFMIGALRRLINHKPSNNKVGFSSSSNTTALSRNGQESAVDFSKSVRTAMLRLKGTVRTGELTTVASDLEENLEETYRVMTQLFSQAYRHMKAVSKTLSKRRQQENDVRVRQHVRRWKHEGEFLLPHRSDDEDDDQKRKKHPRQNRKKQKKKGGGAVRLNQLSSAVQDLTVGGLPADAPQNRFLATERSASSSSASSGGRSLLNEPDDDDNAAAFGGSSPVSTAPTNGSHTPSRSSSAASSDKFVVVSRRFTVMEGGTYDGASPTDPSSPTTTTMDNNNINAPPPPQQHADQEPVSSTPPSSSAACPEADAPLPSPTTDRAAPFGASKVSSPTRPPPPQVVETKQEARARRMKVAKMRKNQTKDSFVYTPLWSSTSSAPPTHTFMKGVSGKPCDEDRDLLLASAPTHPSVHCGFKMAARRPIVAGDGGTVNKNKKAADGTTTTLQQGGDALKGNGGYFIPNRPPPVAPAPPTPPPPPPPADDDEEQDTEAFDQQQQQLSLTTKSSKTMASSVSMKSINNPARKKEKLKRGHSLNKAYVFGASASKRPSSASVIAATTNTNTASSSSVAVDGLLSATEGSLGQQEGDGDEEGVEGDAEDDKSDDDSDDSSSVASMFANTSKAIDMATELNYFTSTLNDHQQKVIARDAARRKRRSTKGKRRSTRAKSSSAGGVGTTSPTAATKVSAKDAGGFHPSEMRPIGDLLTTYALGKDMRRDKILGDKAGFRSLDVLPPIRPSHSRQAQFGGTYLSNSPRWKSGETLFVAPPPPIISGASRNRPIPAPPPPPTASGTRLTHRHQQQQQVPQSA